MSKDKSARLSHANILQLAQEHFGINAAAAQFEKNVKATFQWGAGW